MESAEITCYFVIYGLFVYVMVKVCTVCDVVSLYTKRVFPFLILNYTIPTLKAAFSPFSTMFSTHYSTNFSFSITFILLSASVVNCDQSKNF